MKKLFLSAALAFALSGIAQAKTPPEVLKPYKEYRAALKAGDNDKAYEQAKRAWELAEKMMGDSKTTGDLAANFADINPTKDYTYKKYKERMRVHARAIKLADLHGEAAADMVLVRHLNRIETSLTLARIKNGKYIEGGDGSYFDDMEKALEKYERQGSTYEGDMEVLRARHYELRNNHEKALTAAGKAEELFKKRTDNLSTHYPILLKLFKGNSLRGVDKPIEAALEYQTVMQNLEGAIPAEHPFVKTAFTQWMLTRSELEDAGRLDEAEQAGLCECWPYENYKNQALPLLRVPPRMPSRARRSGHVNVMFDVSAEGKPINIKVINSTEKIFEKPTLDSVAKWRYQAAVDAPEDQARKDVTNKVTFRLTDMGGRLIPEKR